MRTETPSDGAQFDTIVIGSGMGSLTTASLLAQVDGQRVLVIEQHAKLGGFTHSFTRKGFEWDVGLHYVGEMQPGTMPRRVMDLVTGHAVQWHAIGSPYERIMLPGLTFEVPNGAEAFKRALQARFPDDAGQLDTYFKDLKDVQGWVGRWYTSKLYGKVMAKLLTLPGSELALMRTSDYMMRFKSPELRGVLTAQWPNFGTPPHHSVFAQHGMVQAHFLEGGFTPEHGAQSIADAARKVIESHGGSCLVSHPVTQILVEKGRASGVEVARKGSTFRYRARSVVSGAGARTTFEKLVPQPWCSVEREQARQVQPGVSAVVLFLGLKEDPRLHGFDDANYWMYNRIDHDTDRARREGHPERIDGGFLSFCSLRRPGCQRHTAQLITFGPADAWAPYTETTWMKRGDEYLAHKERVAEELLNFVEQRAPGLRNLIEYAELATPRSFEHFSGHTDGWVYGPLCDIHRFTDSQWWSRTSLPGLHLTGSDVGSPGIDGAMMAGMMTAAQLLGPFGLGLPRIFSMVYGKPKPLPSPPQGSGPRTA